MGSAVDLSMNIPIRLQTDSVDEDLAFAGQALAGASWKRRSMNSPEALALLSPCGLPSPNWRGSGCHLAIHEGTQHAEALANLERALEAFQLDTDTWASWAPDETVSDRRR